MLYDHVSIPVTCRTCRHTSKITIHSKSVFTFHHRQSQGLLERVEHIRHKAHCTLSLYDIISLNANLRHQNGGVGQTLYIFLLYWRGSGLGHESTHRLKCHQVCPSPIQSSYSYSSQLTRLSSIFSSLMVMVNRAPSWVGFLTLTQRLNKKQAKKWQKGGICIRYLIHI